MNLRIADNSTAATFTARVNAQRSRLAVLQERLSSGKRINRPSDDPNGAEAVVKIRTSQTEIKQFQRTALAANQKLTAADDSLNGYENLLERVRTLVSQGLSDTATQNAKNALATEIDSLRSRILNVADSKNGDDYLFGGSRQTEPPFDPATAAPSAIPATAQYIQIEPGTNAIPVGVTAESVFSDATSNIFTDLTNAVNALRGTGDAAVDRTTLETTMSRIATYTSLVDVAHAAVGANMNATDLAQENLTNNFLNLDERANDIEGDDFAGTALELADAQRALEATLQVASQGRRTLFDYLG